MCFNVAEEGTARVVPGAAFRKERLHRLAGRAFLGVLFSLGPSQLPPKERGPVEGVPEA